MEKSSECDGDSQRVVAIKLLDENAAHQRLPHRHGPAEDLLHATRGLGRRRRPEEIPPLERRVRRLGRPARAGPPRHDRLRPGRGRGTPRQDASPPRAQRQGGRADAFCRVRRRHRGRRLAGPPRKAAASGAGGHDDLSDEPGHPRDHGLRAAADAGSGGHRRHGRDGLSGGVCGDGPGDPFASGGQQGRHLHVDLRPQDHPGRRVGSLPRLHRGAPLRAARLLRESSDLGIPHRPLRWAWMRSALFGTRGGGDREEARVLELTTRIAFADIDRDSIPCGSSRRPSSGAGSGDFGRRSGSRPAVWTGGLGGAEHLPLREITRSSAAPTAARSDRVSFISGPKRRSGSPARRAVPHRWIPRSAAILPS